MKYLKRVQYLIELILIAVAIVPIVLIGGTYIALRGDLDGQASLFYNAMATIFDLSLIHI